MPLRIYKNKDTATKAENEFLSYLVDQFKITSFNIAIFFNVYLEGTQIDTLIVSEKGIIVIEYKNYSGKLYCSENGPWEIVNISNETIQINKDRENVFEQLRRQRFSVINFIRNHFNDIFPDEKIESKHVEHIGWCLVFEDISLNSEIKLSQNTQRWLNVISKDKTKSYFDNLRPSGLTFNPSNIQNMAKVLDLIEIDYFSQAKSDEENVFCPVCQYVSEKCALPFISGIVIGVENRKIKLNSKDRLITLIYEKESTIELTILNNLFKYFHNFYGKDKLKINLFHLSKVKDEYLIKDDSLIIILPSWVYSVTSFADLDFCQRAAINKKFEFSPSNKNLLQGKALHESFKDIVENPLRKEEAIEKSHNYIIKHPIEFFTSESTSEELDNSIQSNINNLSNWASVQHFQGIPKSEKFLISPMLGLKGKIDLIFEDKGDIVDIKELKSKRFAGKIVNFHELQVVAYGMMAMLKQKKRFSDNYPSIVYYKEIQNQETKSRFDSNVFNEVCLQRNILVETDINLQSITATFKPQYLIHETDELQYLNSKINKSIFIHPMQYPKGCYKCDQNKICMDICRIIHFEYCNTSCFKHPNSNPPNNAICKLEENIDSTLRNRFINWIKFINLIKIIDNNKYSSLNELSCEDRSNLGKVLKVTDFEYQYSIENSHIYKFNIKIGNYSEFRKYDFVLLFDQENLSESNTEIAVIKSLSLHKGEIEVLRKLDFYPKYIGPYKPDRYANLNFLGLYISFLNPDYYKLLYSDDKEFSEVLNKLDIKLIYGPPGSGKTKRIAEIVKSMVDNGQSVLVAAYTNRAIDEIYSNLKEAKLQEKILRIGQEARIQEEFSELMINDMDYHDRERIEEVINSKKIILTTIHSSSIEYIEKIMKYDCVILDEASQINIPMSFIALCRSKAAILVGDFNQLPPLFPIELDELKIEEDIFKLSLFEFIFHKIQKNKFANIEILDTQFRMNDEIAKYPKDIWYNSLKTDIQVADKKLIIPDEKWKTDKYNKVLEPDNPSIWLQVKSESNISSNRINRMEANICADLVLRYIQNGVNPKDIGIIAPYRMQVNEIKNQVEKLSEKKDVESILDYLLIDTIDRFQGTERGLIILSLCNGDNTDNFLINDLRRFNVAITRAKVKRIIVGDIDAYKNEIIRGIVNDGFTKLISFNDN